jgi:hypothetical protein
MRKKELRRKGKNEVTMMLWAILLITIIELKEDAGG